jgi:hypothetical protein
MTAYTKNDLALKTLRQLNIIAIDEVPSSEILNDVMQTIGSEFARMEADGIIMWATTIDSIDEVYFTVLAERMGFAIAPSFGVMDAATAVQGKEASEAVIRRLAAPTKTPEVLVIPREARGTRIRDPLIIQQTP